MRIEPLVGDLRAAFGLLTRFPVRLAGPATAPGLWTFPVVGAAVGAVAAGVAGPLLGFGLAPAGAALVALAASALVTGALHEDGLADTADGLGGGHTTERKLEIMRDSRIGSYGTLALILTVGLRAAGLTRCADAGPWTLAISLVTGHAAARAFAAFAWASSSEARADGLSARMAPTRGSGRFIALGLALGLAVWLQGPRGAGALVAAGLAAAVLTLVARAHVGGVTGDVLGAVEQVSEAAFWTVCGAAI